MHITIKWDCALREHNSSGILWNHLIVKSDLSWGSNVSVVLWKISGVQFSCSVVSDSATPWTAAQQTSLSITNSWACSNSCPSRGGCHPTISLSVIPFSSHHQSFPASGSFPMSQFFTPHGQSTGVSASASVIPKNIQDRFPLGLTALISLQSKELLRVFSNTTVQKHQFFGAQLSLWSNPHIHPNYCFNQMDLCWQSNMSAL